MFGFTPYNIDLYKLALIHKSASLVLEDGTSINNERLEFLGDAIIEAVTSDYLFIEFPGENEGFLTQLRSRIVSRQSLNMLADAVGLSRLVVKNNAFQVSIKDLGGDAFEAIIGAIYLDMGFDFVNRLLINEIFPQYLNIDDLSVNETDFKSRLIEWTQKRHLKVEFVTELDGSSRVGKPVFHSTVIIAGVVVGQGLGESKKLAEQSAAQAVSFGGVSDRDSDELLDKVDRYVGKSSDVN
ncbi:MAG: ribonuclease III [Rikenellaceae bacterium]